MVCWRAGEYGFSRYSLYQRGEFHTSRSRERTSGSLSPPGARQQHSPWSVLSSTLLVVQRAAAARVHSLSYREEEVEEEEKEEEEEEEEAGQAWGRRWERQPRRYRALVS